MINNIIGRKSEISLLEEYVNSSRSEFVAVYGRRRVGKTFLIKELFENRFAFRLTGLDNSSKSEQLTKFYTAMRDKCPSISKPTNWIEAFYMLGKYLETLPEGTKIVFIDELPWFDTPKSGFLPAFENFWNDWCYYRNDIKLIVCGSATNWMIDRVINSRGGLHNRVTRHIRLEPFSLKETREYFETNGFPFDNEEIVDCQMILGGVPYYLSLMDNRLSVAQNIDKLMFASNAILSNEFQNLYRSLFRNAEPHISVIDSLSTEGQGLTRNEIIRHSGLADNGALSKVLRELEECGFIRSYTSFGKSVQDSLYQLIDPFTLFYYKFMKNNTDHEPDFWVRKVGSNIYNNWSGYAFEIFCLNNINLIKQSLGISGVVTNSYSWIYKAPKSNNTDSDSAYQPENAQIDLVIDRADKVINICEIKYSQGKFVIDKEYSYKLKRKIDIFRSQTGTTKSLVLTLITMHGIETNAYSRKVTRCISIDDLID